MKAFLDDEKAAVLSVLIAVPEMVKFTTQTQEDVVCRMRNNLQWIIEKHPDKPEKWAALAVEATDLDVNFSSHRNGKMMQFVPRETLSRVAVHLVKA